MASVTKPVVVNAQTDIGSRSEMTAKQTAELTELCAELGEDYDSSLTEKQAQERISTLREMKASR